MFSITTDRDISVAKVFEGGHINLNFRRQLVGDFRVEWQDLMVQLQQEELEEIIMVEEVMPLISGLGHEID